MGEASTRVREAKGRAPRLLLATLALSLHVPRLPSYRRAKIIELNRRVCTIMNTISEPDLACVCASVSLFV